MDRSYYKTASYEEKPETLVTSSALVGSGSVASNIVPHPHAFDKLSIKGCGYGKTIFQ